VNTYGYVYLSNIDQDDSQLVAMSKLNIPPENIYTDKQSGRGLKRPKYQELLKNLKYGDLLYVYSIYRLGRNCGEILKQWRILTQEIGIDIAVVDIPLLDTRMKKELIGTFVADLTLQILISSANRESNNYRKLQTAGIEAAKSRGVKFGRPMKKPDENFGQTVKLWENGKLPFSEVLIRTGMKEATFYNRLREYRKSL